MSVLDHYDALLLDLDGTVWAGKEPVPNAVETINAAKDRGLPAVYITNNASRGPDEVAAQLRGIGLDTRDSDVMTSAQAAVQLAAQHAQPGDAILVVGAPSFKDLVRQAGFTPVDSADEKPVVVLHGHSPENGWRQLSEAALAIRAGATYLASNLDSTLPSDRGFMVGNGSMVAAVTNATSVVPQAAGKPGPAMFELAKENLGVNAPLVIGDRLDTDIAGGVAAGMDTLHVLTGVSGPLALIAAPAEQRPTFIANDMSALVDDSLTPDDLRPSAQGRFSAELETGGAEGLTVRLDGGDEHSTAVQALRTVLAVLWADQGQSSDAGTGAGGAGGPVVKPASDAAKAAVEAWW